jgi:hypothetical protein
MNHTKYLMIQTLSITILINHQPDATIFQFIILTFIYSSTCFGAFSHPSSGAQRMQYQPLVLPSYRGDSSDVGRGRAGPTTTNSTAITTLQR